MDHSHIKKENLKIGKTIEPPIQLDQIEWMKTFKVGRLFNKTEIRNEIGFSTIFRERATSNMETKSVNMSKFKTFINNISNSKIKNFI